MFVLERFLKRIKRREKKDYSEEYVEPPLLKIHHRAGDPIHIPANQSVVYHNSVQSAVDSMARDLQHSARTARPIANLPPSIYGTRRKPPLRTFPR